ncbi:hypothetical protein Fmac_005091 [Flemingia macrophylla]|uniref:Peptidase C14 caspase domain-containing protein n=1 Tax=Flemingia macrophylla TaxID=520843 RepID=A0ABD1N6T7_9FABA
MTNKQKRCNHCGRLLVVPQGVHVFECAVCHGITRIEPTTSPWSQAYNNVRRIAGRFRGFVNTIMASSVSTNSGYYGKTQFGYYPQPQLPSLTPSYHAYGSKRAVLCGIRYHGKSYSLKGSVNDVKCMKYFLVKEFGFPGDSILMLTGHGTREMNMDGFVEAICPLDYEQHGKIIDSEINAAIVGSLPRGATLHAIIDACHSGTVLDLSFQCKMNREGYYTWEDRRSCRNDKGASGGLVICISACEDGQISIDTSALSGKVVTGALTYSFIQTVQNERGLSYGRMLSGMRSTIRGTKTGIVQLNGPIASLLNRFLGPEIKQEPQLSSSEMFDMYTKQFVL